MSRSLLSVYLLFCIFLSACIPARAEDAAQGTGTFPASITGEAPPLSTVNAEHTPGPTADLSALGAYSSSVLVADGGGGQLGSDMLVDEDRVAVRIDQH